MYRLIALGLFAWFAFGSIFLIGRPPACEDIRTSEVLSAVLALAIFMAFAFAAGRESRNG